MSQELRVALRTILRQFARSGGDVPTYLHDPVTGEPYGLLLPLEMNPLEPEANHSHLAGDEDE